ncbi:MAG: collagen-binding domain-containing protein [Nitrospirota bacterium]
MSYLLRFYIIFIISFILIYIPLLKVEAKKPDDPPVPTATLAPVATATSATVQTPANTLLPGDYRGSGALNGNRTLVSGTYVFDGITLNGNDTIDINPSYLSDIDGDGNIDPVIIYVNGDIAISGNGKLNNTSTPTKLFIYGTANCDSVALHGNGELRTALYAPNADISLGGGGNDDVDICGSVVGKTVTSGGHFRIHYDEALAEIDDSQSVKKLDKGNAKWIWNY